ncbi:MAG: helix-turn-helix domain-containing protein [Acidimicrobiales bacterium]|jgi:AcrR family transcriptional regulator
MTVRSEAEEMTVEGSATVQADPEIARPMRADARRNYERLVAAARTVFAQQGGGASMDAIAKEAGVGVGTLYRHFPRRIDVVEAVYREDVDQLVDAAERFSSELEPWPAVAAWLEAFVDYAIGKRRFLNELHEAFEKNPDLKIAARERIEGALGVVLTRAQGAGVVRDDLDGPDLMQLLGSMCLSATLTPAQSARLLVVILDGLRPPA